MKTEYNGLEIAVIGMAGRFPKSKDLDEFWTNLKEGKELISFYTDEELIEAGIDENLLKNPNYIKAQGYLEGSEYFDPSFFGYTTDEAEVMDPQTRLFHEYAYKALEQAGYLPNNYKGLIGLFAGGGYNFQWAVKNYIQNDIDFAKSLLINTQTLATLVSYKLNLKGPSYTLYTACSTSLVAIHNATQSLLNGECDIALTGGVTVPDRKSGYLYQEGMISSSDGHNRTFDAKASGTVGSSGIGIVVLKRLDEALKDNDHIYAIIKGSAINNDGNRKVGYTAPSIDGQLEVIKLAQLISDIPAESISYVECHGTATNLGDPVEVEALKLAFNSDKRNSCGIGSVKSNIGHTDIAAGVAGFIKAVLCLNHRTLVPSLHFENPNPKIDFENSPFYVITDTKKWKNELYPLRASVTSLGIGGTNAHLILEEAPNKILSSKSRDFKLILLSGKTKTALDNNALNMKEYLIEHQEIDLADAAYTLQIGREHFKHRLMAVGRTIKEIMEATESNSIRETIILNEGRKIVFMFPGQGSQYVNMGRELYQSEIFFKKEMDLCFEIVQKLTGKNLRDIIFPENMKEDSAMSVNSTDIAQPLIFILEYCLAKLMIHWGVNPETMIGHSIGEYVAACLSRVFSLEDGLQLVIERGRIIAKANNGVMISVMIRERCLIELLDEDISLAAVNSSELCVVSGTIEAITRFEKKLMKQGYKSTRLSTSHAFHSYMMDEILEEFRNFVSKIVLHSPQNRYISNLSGTWINELEVKTAEYWVRHLRCTVKFSEGLEELFKVEERLFIEIGPGGALSSFVNTHKSRQEKQIALTSMRKPKEKENDVKYLTNLLGRLWMNGVDIKWEKYYEGENRLKVVLPTYEFDKHECEIRVDVEKEINRNRNNGFNTDLHKTNIYDWFYFSNWNLVFLPEIEEVTQKNKQYVVISDNSFLSSSFQRELEIKKKEYTLLNDCSVSIDDYDSYLLHSFDKIYFKNDIEINVICFFVLNETKSTSFYYKLLSIAKILGNNYERFGIKIFVLTNTVYEIVGNENIIPIQSIVTGPIKVIPKEYENISCYQVDLDVKNLDNEFSSSITASNLLKLTCNLGFIDLKQQIYGLRGKKIWQPVVEKLSIKEEWKSNLKYGGVYLITGGMRGIGFVIAEYLATTFKAKLILVTRASFPNKESWQEILEKNDINKDLRKKIKEILKMEENGAEILVVTTDVTDSDSINELKNLIMQKYGRLNGVIHSAGIADGGLINFRNKQSSEFVFAPKITGTINLDYLLNEFDSDFMVLFSSLSSIIGPLGQVAYVSANAFLDTYALKRSLAGKPTISINWDTWKDIGMAFDILNEDKNDKTHLLHGISSDEGKRIFEVILKQKNPQVIVSTHDLKYRIMHDKINRNLMEEQENLDHDDDVLEINIDDRESLQRFIKRLVEKHKRNYEELKVGDNFFDIGLTSLDIINIYSELKNKIKINVTLIGMYEHTSVSQLTDYIREIANGYELKTDNLKEEYIITTNMKNKLKQLKERGR